MKWGPKPKRPEYAQVSNDKRYSVCWIGFAGGGFYEAWRTRIHEDGPHLVATNLQTADEARFICAADARG